jgi:hypothetical protein
MVFDARYDIDISLDGANSHGRNATLSNYAPKIYEQDGSCVTRNVSGVSFINPNHIQYGQMMPLSYVDFESRHNCET